VIRHCARTCGPRITLYGTDYNQETVAWCRDHLDGITFHVNGLAPPLPFADAFLDCVYAISVLTHLSEDRHFDWINELARVVRPGGIVVLTTHGDASRDRLLESEKLRYAAGELVVRGQVQEGKKWYLAYQSAAFMRDQLLKNWEVVSHTPYSTTQDAWVARR
jgi:ubiquinone/menaquinone biosynthesis C-methylase UbiE